MHPRILALTFPFRSVRNGLRTAARRSLAGLIEKDGFEFGMSLPTPFVVLLYWYGGTPALIGDFGAWTDLSTPIAALFELEPRGSNREGP